MRDIDDTIQRMRLLAIDHEPDGWPAVQMRDITELLDEIERRFGVGGELICARRERDGARTENTKLRAALEEILHSTYLRHATAVAAIALGHEA